MNIESKHSNDVGVIYLKMNRLQWFTENGDAVYVKKEL